MCQKCAFAKTNYLESSQLILARVSISVTLLQNLDGFVIFFSFLEFDLKRLCFSSHVAKKEQILLFGSH